MIEITDHGTDCAGDPCRHQTGAGPMFLSPDAYRWYGGDVIPPRFGKLDTPSRQPVTRSAQW